MTDAKRLPAVCIISFLLCLLLVGCNSSSINITENKYNVIGNSSTNVHSGGRIAYQDGWYYFDDGGSLSKIKEDGTERTELFPSFKGANINVVGKWIYYTNADGIFKIKIDGSENQIIYNCDIGSNMIVVKDWIYYDISELGIQKIKTDGTDKKTIVYGERFVDYPFYTDLIIDENWIYYFYKASYSEKSGIYRVNIDGSQQSILYKCADLDSEMVLYDDYIYFSTMGKICKIKTDSNNSDSNDLEIVIDRNSKDEIGEIYMSIEDFNLMGDYIYIAEQSGCSIFKMNIKSGKFDKIVFNDVDERPTNLPLYDYFLNNYYIYGQSEHSSVSGKSYYWYKLYDENHELVMTIE